MTMRPPPQMGPPRTPAAADQTTSGFAFAQATWDAYFDQSCALTLSSGDESTEVTPAAESAAAPLTPPNAQIHATIS